jgi:hypothetical protein
LGKFSFPPTHQKKKKKKNLFLKGKFGFSMVKLRVFSEDFGQIWFFYSFYLSSVLPQNGSLMYSNVTLVGF